MLKSDRGVLVFACRVYGRACHWCVSGRGAQWRGGAGWGGRGGGGSARVIGARAGEQRIGGAGARTLVFFCGKYTTPNEGILGLA